MQTSLGNAVTVPCPQDSMPAALLRIGAKRLPATDFNLRNTFHLARRLNKELLKNYYAILEVPVGASLEEIRQAYRRLVQEHLDDEAVFADLKEAYEVLSTPTRRAEYDQTVWGGTFDAPSSLAASGPSGGRCPMGAEANCPVLQGRATLAETYCPDCGFALAGLSSGKAFDAETDPTRPWLEGQTGENHPLHVGSNTVGRDSGDVLVADKTVSRLHARLELSADGSLTVEDLASTNGTQVNEVLLTPNAPRSLADGDRLRFGSISLTLHLPVDAAPEKAPGAAAYEAPAAEASSGGAQVVGIGEGDERTFLLKPGMTTFGRRPENTVVLSGDLYVSGSHAQISAEEGVFILTDIGSTNGTLLNGERLKIHAPVQLSDGDEILIGGTALRFERLEQSAPPEASILSESGAEDASEQNASEQNASEQNASEHAEG